MKQAQQGFGLIALIIVIAIIAIMAGFYFTGGPDEQKSELETGQDAVDQARGINQQSGTQARELQQQIELQNDLNTQ